VQQVRRRYRGKTLVLETEFVTDEGVVRLTDFMPIREGNPHVVRILEGVRGSVRMGFDLRPRFAYGQTVPRPIRADGTEAVIAGPDALYLRGGTGLSPVSHQHEVTLSAGQSLPYVLSWAHPYRDIPAPIDPEQALIETVRFWEGWTARLRLPAGFEELVLRSLITLKACTYRPSGAIVAAPTFGLPETPGGERNWDYRFCWIRDSVLTLNALIRAGLGEEAQAFGRWLLDAIGGAPQQLQIMYGIRGERFLPELTLGWLPGYEGARPVRIGNGAFDQFQLDVLGEFSAVLYAYIHLVGEVREQAHRAMKNVAGRVAEVWRKPDHGIWEMRGPKRHFTASKVTAWTAVDRWVRCIEEFGLAEDTAPWRALRQEIFDEVCSQGFDPQRNTFTQYYGSKGLDASLLAIPLSGFLPPDDPRVAGTIAAVEEELLEGGFLLRYRTEEGVDGLSGEEGVFLACSFWLVDAYLLVGRHQEARALFDRLAGLCNDVGLLAEEYLPSQRRQLGNFPQAFSHLAMVNAAYTLARVSGPGSYPG
jgi:GH15 family glucan-1,4-alpha-glucosidase